MSNRLQETIDKKLAPRLDNTPKQAREAKAQRCDGYNLQGVQAILRAIADKANDGTLSAIANKAQIETLMRCTEEDILAGKGGINGIMAKLKLSPKQMVELLWLSSCLRYSYSDNTKKLNCPKSQLRYFWAYQSE